MAKFNSPVTIKTTNKCGHVAYSMGDKEKLVTQVLTSFVNEGKFYGDNTAEMQETIKRVIAKEPQFVSKLAVFARREFNMRSVAHVLTAYLAHEVEGKPFARETVKGVSLRGDDITEIISFYLATFGKPVPNSLKKGINDVLRDLDEYSLAKYKGDGKSVKMRDLICLCHPTPKDNAQAELWKRCLEETLATPKTWETELSANGNNAETWGKLIESGKVGYMALLRNLNNIIKANPSNIETVYQTIENPERVRKSKQLPFRFLSAYKAVSDTGSSRVFDALESAVDVSAENLPKLRGTTVIAVDTSGSMSSKVSAKSDITCAEIGMMLGLIANRICDNSIFYTFDTELSKYAISRRNGIIYASIHAKAPGSNTNMGLPFLAMIQENIKADRIVVISDNMCNSGWSMYGRNTVQSLANEYRRITGNDIWVHAIDLQGYGTQQFHGPKTNIIAGWSEKVLQFIPIAEAGSGALQSAIENYEC